MHAEWPVNVWCLGLFGWLFKEAERKERIEMLTVLAFATPMELFFSEVWLIYEYQRTNASIRASWSLVFV